MFGLPEELKTLNCEAIIAAFQVARSQAGDLGVPVKVTGGKIGRPFPGSRGGCPTAPAALPLLVGPSRCVLGKQLGPYQVVTVVAL